MNARDEFTATLTTLRGREAMQVAPSGLAVRVSGGRQETTVPLAGTRAIGGRTSTHAIALDDASVSATHFELALSGDGSVVLRDLGSKNGTSIHGVRVREAVLEPGVRFSAGTVPLELVRVDRRELPVSLSDQFGGLLGRGVAMGRLFADLARLAEHPFDVLVRGETGTGKELVARALHEHSSRSGGPFVILDCTTLPSSLAESLLFGHRRGAFTGASEDATGYFEDASGGTLVIDELGKLPLELQAKLLRALESREIVRVGETKRRPVDVRVIAATNRDLARMMADGELLEDLYYRMGGIEIEIPPLRERGRPNLEHLASAFLERASEPTGAVPTISPSAYDAMARYSWPGNVRELQRLMGRAVFWAQGASMIEPHHLRLSDSDREQPAVIDDLLALPYKEARAEFEALLLRKVWGEVEGNVSEAARRMGLDRRTITKLVDQLGLRSR